MIIGIIVPCYNEGESLNTEAILKFMQISKGYYLCFVNDGSNDNTLSVLRDVKAQISERVSIVDVKKNKGKAAAVWVGARYLSNKENIDYIAYMSANNFSGPESLILNLDKENLTMPVFKSICKTEDLKKGFLEAVI